MPRKQSINGEREITLSFLRGDINDKFIADIETGWIANFKGDKYHLFNEREDQHGNKEFDAVLDFFHHFNGRWHMDDVDDTSMTIDDSIRPLFDDSPYVLSIIDNFYANTMNYSKQQNSTERFLYFIGRHNAEFNIPIGTQTVQVRNKIGVQRNDVFIHEDDNLVDFNIRTDTGSFCTAIKGYYRFRVPAGSGDSTEKEPTREYDYISPMASKYGVIWGEPIHDERFDTLEGIQAATKQKQEATWKSSFEIAAERFSTPLNIGDEVRFIVPSKSINGYIRVVEINEQFDEEGELIEATYTFGNENIANQYRKMQYDALQDVHDILNGRKPIPYSVLPKAVREATAIINAGDSTQFYYQEDGIYGFNKDNPNWSVRMNANGLGYSVDGGQNYNNAITHLGVVTEALTAGTIDANRITIYGAKQTKRVEINGDRIKVWDSSNPDKYTNITPQGAHFRNGHVRISTSSGRDVINNGYILRNPAVSWTYPQSFGTDVRQGDGEFSKNYILTSSNQYQTGGFFSFSHEARYLRVYVTLNTLSSAPAARARLRMLNQYSNEHRTTLDDDLEYGSRLLMDIGEPLDYGVRRYCYVEFRKEGDGDTVAGLRINTREQTDFP